MRKSKTFWAFVALVVAMVFPAAANAQFAGTWNTSFGRMDLTQTGAQASGSYEYAANSRISGKVENGKFVFTYVEPTAAGEGWFQISPDGQSFTGQWRENGSANWDSWSGKRPPVLTQLDSAMDKIVQADSSTWMLWRYDGGSMHSAKVVSNANGKTVLRGEYTYNGGRAGWVQIQMAGENVECLEFWNEGRCRALGRPSSYGIAAALAVAAMTGGGGGSSTGGIAYEDTADGIKARQDRDFARDLGH